MIGSTLEAASIGVNDSRPAALAYPKRPVRRPRPAAPRPNRAPDPAENCDWLHPREKPL